MGLGAKQACQYSRYDTNIWGTHLYTFNNHSIHITVYPSCHKVWERAHHEQVTSPSQIQRRQTTVHTNCHTCGWFRPTRTCLFLDCGRKPTYPHEYRENMQTPHRKNPADIWTGFSWRVTVRTTTTTCSPIWGITKQKNVKQHKVYMRPDYTKKSVSTTQCIPTLMQLESSFIHFSYQLYPIQGRGEGEAHRCYHWARGRVHPVQVASPLQGPVWVFSGLIPHSFFQSLLDCCSLEAWRNSWLYCVRTYTKQHS